MTSPSESMSRAEARALFSKPKRSKYGAKRCELDGIKFDSQAEAKRWCELLILEKTGAIRNLRRQVWHSLVSANGAVACRYRSDFDYETDAGETVTEDVKGFLTRDFKIKAKLFLAQYGREIRVVRA